MKKTVLVTMVILALSLVGCATMKDSLRSKMLLDDGSITVVIIPGAGEDNLRITKKWQDAFPDSIIITPETRWPLYLGAEDIARQTERIITGRVVIIGLSFGGNLGREFDAMFSHLTVAVLTVGSPNTVKYMVEFPAVWSIRPNDGNSNTPLFVAVGVKPGIPKPVWMDDPSDGTIGLAQATDFRDRKVKEITVFEYEHTALLENDEVIAWALERLKPFLKPKQPTLVASATEK